MKRSSYRDRDYAFGQAMLTFRSAMGLTQSALAHLLGISRFALGEWEAGSTYPKLEHLKHFIALGVERKVFPNGREAEEIRALWRLAHQKVLLDERWLTDLLAPTGSAPDPILPANDTSSMRSEQGRVAPLPTQPTPFIGRAEELTGIARILADPACRLLTLLGPGGVGKTRLALAVAAEKTDAFADGVVFVPLASVSSSNQMVSAISDALGSSSTGQADSPEQLFAYLRERRLLIVLDHFEHLLESADLVSRLLDNAPQVSVLITSRERLNLRMEWLFDVAGLAYPSTEPSERDRTPVARSAPEEAPAHPPFHPAPAQKPRVDWGGALSVPAFYGRDRELSLLTDWIIADHCRIVSVVGFGGIGKSTLAVQWMRQRADQFEAVIWRSLRDVPTYGALLDDCLHVLAAPPLEALPASLEERQNLLLNDLRTTRVLLVFDNLESILGDGENAGRLRPGYEDFGRVLYRIAGTEHQSCILLTSREKLGDLVSQEGSRAPVRTLRLTPLDSDSCEQLLAEKDISGSESEKARLIEAYAGNPLALKIVAQTIVELFEGEITPFLEQGEVIFGGVRRLLDEHFTRLSRLERDVMIWLAILREPSTLDDLRAVLVRPTASAGLLEAIQSLSRRSLIEHGQLRGTFTLQSVVLEYVTARLTAIMSDEIERGQTDHLVDYALELAHVREYVRQIEARLIAVPVLERLRSIYSSQARLGDHLLALLKGMSGQIEAAQGYGPANLVLLLRLLRGHLRGVDLSHLVLRDLYLQGVEMQDARLVNATIQDSFFTEAFDALTAVATSSTGEHWAASSRRGEIRIWEAGGQTLRHAWRGHISTIWSLTFSPNGQILASGSNDGALRLWEVGSGRLLWSGKHPSDVSRLSFSPDGRTLASAVNDGSICLWNAASGRLLQRLPQPSPLATVLWSPDGQCFATGDVEGGIRLWAANQMAPATHLRTLTGHGDCADGLAFSPDGRTLASASWDGTVKLWEVASGRLLQTLTGHTDRVGRIVWSRDGTTIASSSADQTVLLWDVEQGRYRAALKGHDSHVYDLAFTPDSRNLLTSSRDGSLRVWDVVSEECVHVIRGYAASIHDVDWSPDGNMLVSGGTDLVVTVWDAVTGTPLRVLQEHTGVVCAVGWSPDGRWLASSDTEYGIRLWELNAGENFRFLRQPDNSGNTLYDVAWSPDGHALASGTHRHGVIIWDMRSGEEIWIVRQSSTWFPVLAWSPDGTRLAGGGLDGRITIWNIADDTLEQVLVGHQTRINGLAWSPDGARLASGAGGAEGGELFVWDLRHGQRAQSFAGHNSVVSAVVWDASGERLISGGGRGMLRWWDVQTGECLWVREAHDGAIQSLRTSPDGMKLASCGDDGAIRLWDLASGEPLQTLRHDRPYERLNITGIRGLTEAQKKMLYALGAIEDQAV